MNAKGLFDLRAWAVVFLLAGLVLAIGPAMVGPEVNRGEGLVDYPNQDCGNNFFGLFLPGLNGRPCVFGSASQDSVDEMLDQRGAADRSASEGIDDLLGEVLVSLARRWGMIR
jgi:hypothetical protein